MNKQILQSPPIVVAIAIRHMPQYRKEFYDGLQEVLNRKNIILKVIYGQASKSDMLKGDMVELPWGIRIENKILQIGNKELYWQPFFPYIKGADLVIVEPGSRLLANYLLILLGKFSGRKIAYWGHGENFQKTHAVPLSEWIKRVVSRRVHWHFAYTDRSAKIIQGFGYPLERITVVQNAIDTQSLERARALINERELISLRNKLGLKGNHIGLFVGGMYREKKLDFLMEACKLIRQQVPDFEMLMIGSGMDAHIAMEFEKSNPWLHYLGPKFDREKVPYFAISKLFLMPGLVGLAILDCFALEVPLVATQNPDNSHEIDYLLDGKNGIMINNDITPAHYAQVVSDLITNDDRLNALVEGCRTSAQKYTIANMITNFAEGVVKALA